MKILLVEDDRMIGWGLRRGLLDEGVGVLGAERHDVAAGCARLELGAYGVHLCRGAKGQR